MRVYIAIDDTDSLEIGATGRSANELRKLIKDRGWGKTQAVTRHQLLLHSDIPYTSHNSSMCFIADIREDCCDELIAAAGEYLETTSAPGSDPGLCVAIDHQIKELDSLMSFGFKAKEEILNKEVAYKTAVKCNIHLSEHGGTGDGIIGALAGIALRMSGNDGRFQGRTELKEPGEMMAIGDVLAHSDIDEVQSIEGELLAADETLILGEKIKSVLLDGKKKLLVYREGDEWHTCNNKQLRAY
ncbi:MAG: hypothetical protein PHC92_09565 [Syntrophomonadaceae bacterium]|nr:hypothetical protein [Syntrophomonadaceae bacterium]